MCGDFSNDKCIIKCMTNLQPICMSKQLYANGVLGHNMIVLCYKYGLPSQNGGYYIYDDAEH